MIQIERCRPCILEGARQGMWPAYCDSIVNRARPGSHGVADREAQIPAGVAGRGAQVCDPIHLNIFCPVASCFLNDVFLVVILCQNFAPRSYVYLVSDLKHPVCA
jgi:hypothetical protein